MKTLPRVKNEVEEFPRRRRRRKKKKKKKKTKSFTKGVWILYRICRERFL